MTKTTILAVLLASCLVATGETNDTSVTLSGLLRLGKPMVDLSAYCLDVTILGGGTQRVYLKGKKLDQFKEQIKKSQYNHVPVRVTGQFKTDFMGNSNPSPQPTMPGWMIWLEVESVVEEILIKKPQIIEKGANKTQEGTSQ